MTAVVNDLEPGFEIHWYRIESVLGRGGFGITYLARDNNLDKNVAIKEYLPHDFAKRGDDSTVQPVSKAYKDDYRYGLDRFMKEAKTLAKFKHPNIAHVSSCFELNNTGYMVMEYEHGKPLNEIYETKGKLTQRELEAIYLPIMDGLSLVHEAGFIHRDIKPSNIYIRHDNSPVLIDFGAARQTVGTSNMTLTSMLTEGYAPSEQYNQNSDEQGPWTDVYALGACLYQGITGDKPVSSTERTHDIHNKNIDPLRPLSRMDIEGYQPAFLRAVDEALRVRFGDRPQSLDEFIGMLKGEIPLPDLPGPGTAEVDKSNDGRTVIRPGRDEIAGTPGSAGSRNLAKTKTRIREAPASAVGDKRAGFRQTALLFAIGVIAVAGGAAYFLVPAQKTQVEILLEQAAGHVATENYYNENGTGAFATYQSILEIEPANEAARQGIDQVRDHYLRQAEKMMQTSKLIEAGESLKIARLIAPAHPALKDAQTRLSALLKRKQIENYLDQAQISLDQDRIYEPEQDSALFYLRNVLKLDPENVTARLGLSQIVNGLLGEARAELDANNLQRAESLIDQAAVIDPGEQAIQRIRDEIDERNKLSQLLTAADRAFARTRYTTPRDDNAFALYNQVLDIDPSNPHALEQLDKIAEFYADRTRRFIRSGKLNNAGSSVAVLESHFPDYPAIATLKRDIRQKRVESDPPEPAPKKASAPRHLLPVGVNQQQADRLVVQSIVGGFLDAFRKRDIGTLSGIAQLTSRQRALYTQIFDAYQSIRINLVPGSLGLDSNTGVARARFEITELIDQNGDAVLASQGWGKISVKIARQNGEWLKAEVN